MDCHPVVEKILTLLRENNLWHETFEHEPVRTSEEAAKLRHGYDISQGAKALIVKIKIPTVGKKFVMLVIPGNAKFDNTKVKQQVGASEIRFATPDEVGELTGGIEPGGVPPFGNLFHLDVFADETLLANEKIIFNAGDRRFSVAMLAKDYVALVRPQLVHVIEIT